MTQAASWLHPVAHSHRSSSQVAIEILLYQVLTLVYILRQLNSLSLFLHARHSYVTLTVTHTRLFVLHASCKPLGREYRLKRSEFWLNMP
jgi:hypothetical protein